MAVIRSPGERLAKDLFMGKNFLLNDWEHIARLKAEKATFLEQKRLTIRSAVEHFKTKERFLRTMDPLEDYRGDLVAWEFIQGVVVRFDEIEGEKANGFDWVYRELQATA